MRAYWKVRKDNFSDFINYINSNYDLYTEVDLNYVMNLYPNDMNFFIDREYNYLYFAVENESINNGQFNLSYMYVNIEAYEYYTREQWKDMGEYISRKDKLNILNVLSKNDIQ